VPTEAWLKSAKALQTSTDPEAALVTPLSYMGELPDQMPMFAWAGVGLSKQETYRVYLAMEQLKKKYELPMVRFFGKVFGTKADYVIIEAAGNKGAHKPPSGPAGATAPEEPGVGLNWGTYFVSSSACEDFVQLEDVTPEQVLKSMTIRKYFTGDLTSSVACYPAFPGPEAAYLRAQIARIAQATVVAPAGKLMVDDESEQTYPKPIKENPEYAVPEGLPELGSWVHTYQGILKIGRCTNVPVPEPVEGEEEPEPVEVEEETEPLGTIGDDGAVKQFSEEESLPAWSAKMYHAEFDAYSVAIAKSNRWPGAYAALAKSGDKAASVYFGSGHEATGTAFTPLAPPPVLPESTETEEATEVALADENALLKEIDEAKLAAMNTEGEEAEE